MNGDRNLRPSSCLAIAALTCFSLSLAGCGGSDADSTILHAEPEAFEQAGAYGSARSEVLVLGTDHHSGWAAAQPEWFDSLNARLAQWGPDLVLIERPTVWQAELYASQEEWFGTTGARTVGFEFTGARDAQAALGLTGHAASERLRSGQAGLDDRLNLTLTLMAAFDAASAAMHWAGLSDAQKEDVEARAPEAARVIGAVARSRNETQWIAARVAGALGHVRLHPYDDQIEKGAFAASGLIERLAEDGRLDAVLGTTMLAELHGAQARRPDAADGVLDWYRFINSNEFARIDAEGQWGSFLAEGGEEGRARVALWEARNLRMTANIREIMALHGGERVLVIVGAAHRGWLETYLARQSDIEIVRLDAVLSEP